MQRIKTMKSKSVQTTTVTALMLILVAMTGGVAGPVRKGTAPEPSRTSLKLACTPMTTLDVEDRLGGVFGNGFYFLVSVMARHRVDINITMVPRMRGIIGVKSGKYDGLCSCLSNEKLGSAFHQSNPLGYLSVGAISNRNANHVFGTTKSDDVVKGQLRWGVVSSDGLYDYLRSEGIVNFASLETYEQGYRMLDLDRIDMLLVHKSSARGLGTEPSFDLKYQYRELFRPTLHFCLAGLKGKKIIDELDGTLGNYMKSTMRRGVLTK
jgi:ABC-type amino acid transport substrate-binding protein